MKPSSTERITQRWHAAHPNHHRALQGLASISAFMLIAKLAAALKEVIVAGRYGVSGIVDAYYLAFTITTWLPTVMVSVGTTVLVPRLVGLLQPGETRHRFTAEINGTALALGLVLCVVTLFVGPWLVGALTGNLSADTQMTARTMVWALSPLPLLVIVTGLTSIRLQSLEHHVYALTETAPAVCIALFVVFAPSGIDPQPLILGTLLGVLAQALWSGRLLHRTTGTLGGLAWKHVSPNWHGLYAALKVMALGSLIMSLITPIDQFFAASLAEGTVAALGYANRVIALATGFGAVAVGRALLPVLSSAAASAEANLGYRQALRWTWLGFAIGTILAVAGWLLSPWAVAVLFERGSFTAGDTHLVAGILRAGLPQLPFFFGGIVLVQWLAAHGQYRILLNAAIVAVITKIALNAALLQVFGAAGIALATSAVYALSFAMQLTMMVRSRK
jgi:peptidoglycan biosynthesis protein MviN/MurJ (putative lipid II flippase)